MDTDFENCIYCDLPDCPYEPSYDGSEIDDDLPPEPDDEFFPPED